MSWHQRVHERGGASLTLSPHVSTQSAPRFCLRAFVWWHSHRKAHSMAELALDAEAMHQWLKMSPAKARHGPEAG